jgi:HEAT repeat protein
VEGYTPQSRAAMALVNFSGTAGSGPQAPTRVIRVTSPFLVPLLNDALQNPSAEVRSAALSSLGKIGAGSVPGLLIALKNADPEVRGLAALALKSMGTGAAPAVAELATALSDPVEPVRIGAADALGAIGPAATAAVPALAARLADKSEGRFVFRSSLQSLGMIGPGAKAALPTLDEIVRQTGPNSVAAQTIRLIEGKDVATYY